MGNKPVVPETSSPAADRRQSRSKRATLASKGKTEISNPVQKPLTHRPYIDIGYQEDAEGVCTCISYLYWLKIQGTYACVCMYIKNV